MSLRIKSAEARSFKAFADFSQEFGDVVLFSGHNSAGKSSALDMICAAFITDGGRDLLRVGADDGMIAVVLQDTQSGETFEISRTLKPGKVSQPTVKSSRGGKMGAAVEFIKTVLDTVTLDPIRRVLNASEEEQSRILLETLPLNLDYQELVAAVGDLDVLNLPTTLANAKRLEPLKAIATVHKLLYDTRKDVNREAKKDRAAGEKLRESAGPVPTEGDWGSESVRLFEALKALGDQQAARVKSVETEYTKALQDVVTRQTQASCDLDDEIDAKIEALNRERAYRKAAIGDQWRKEESLIHDVQKVDLLSIDQEFAPERQRLSGEHARAQTLSENDARRRQTLEFATGHEADAMAGEARSKSMTAALDALDRLHEKLLATIPIRGLTRTEAGRWLLNGLPLAETNLAERMKFWLRIAVMRAEERDLAAVVLDDLEHLDSENWDKLVTSCKNSGLQFFMGRMENHEFRITNL